MFALFLIMTFFTILLLYFKQHIVVAPIDAKGLGRIGVTEKTESADYQHYDDGKAAESCVDHRNEDGNDAIYQLILKVDDQRWCGRRGVSPVRDVFCEAGPFNAIDEWESTFSKADAVR